MCIYICIIYVYMGKERMALVFPYTPIMCLYIYIYETAAKQLSCRVVRKTLFDQFLGSPLQLAARNMLLERLFHGEVHICLKTFDHLLEIGLKGILLLGAGGKRHTPPSSGSTLAK